jgi:cytochrome b561
LYVLFFAVPLLGWAYSSAAGFPIVVFGLWQLPDFVPISESLADTLKLLHKLSAFGLAGLVLLHVAGALKHQLIDRDGLLYRMGWGKPVDLADRRPPSPSRSASSSSSSSSPLSR